MEQKTVALVQQSWEKVAPIAPQAAELFYQNLFAADPGLKVLFRGDMRDQGHKLMQMIGAAVGKLDDTETLIPIVRNLGARHGRYGVQAAHYHTVGAALLQTLGQGLGDAFTPDVKAACTDVYGLLAGVMLAESTRVPREVLESLLRDHLGSQEATITDYTSTPFANEGTNDSTAFYRVTLNWTRTASALDTQTTTWILKHWKAGGRRDQRLGITQSREVLAWEQGWLRPAALPVGLVVPLIGIWRSPDHAPGQSEAWLALKDVSTELAAYPRMSLSGDQAVSRTQAILARLAHFHALWEEPERQAALDVCSWLRRPEAYLWDMASTYARALGFPPSVDAPPAATAPPVWAGLSADLDAFLEARPADERRLWEHLLIDRTALVEGLAAYPQTLLHHDLDDRNIGLRWSGGAAQSSALDQSDPFVSRRASLVLIDWEWMARGPAAVDVANIIQRVPVLIRPGAPIPAAVWNNALADGYFAHYRAAGGRIMDAAAWRRAHGLAFVAQGMVQMPFIHGSLRRAIRGELPPPQIVGVPEAVMRQQLQAGLPMMEKMEERVIGEARRWLG